MSRGRLIIALMVIFSTLFWAAPAAAADTVVVVTENDVQAGAPPSLGQAGTSWWTADTRADGQVAIVAGPGTPPIGAGSLKLATDSTLDNNASNAKAQLFYYGFVGTKLSDITALTYDTYRDSTSTNSAVQYPSINMEVDFKGDGTSYTTLVWEPVYAYGASALQEDIWQPWDTMAASQTNYTGGWWSSKVIPGVCAFSCYVSWQTILDNNPDAKIVGGFGLNIGSGWSGVFSGNVDRLAITIGGNTTTFDFDPAVTPPSNARQCVSGGWQEFNNPPFESQFDCTRYVVVQRVQQLMNNLCSRIGNPPFCQRSVFVSP